MSKIIRALGVISATVWLFSGQAIAQVKWDLPTPYQATDHHVENLKLFAADVAKATNNKFQITVHINGSLFKQAEIKRAVQGRQAQAGEFVFSQYQNEWPIFGMDNIPFLATNQDDAWKLYQAQKPALQKKLDQQGLMMLYTVPWPGQGIYSKKELHSAADFKGLKWRAYSPSTARVAELLQAQPVTIPAAELSQAMATGVIDSYMSSATTGVSTKSYEYMTYFYDVRAWLPKNVVVVNKRDYAELTPQMQTALREAAALAEKRGWDMARAKSDKDRQSLVDSGMKVLEASPELSADLHKVGDQMLTEWLKTAGADGKAILDAYRAH